MAPRAVTLLRFTVLGLEMVLRSSAQIERQGQEELPGIQL